LPQQKKATDKQTLKRNDLLRSFSQRLQKALQESGYNVITDQEKLAKEFEVSRQAVRKWIEGKTLPSSTRIPDIAGSLGVNHSWLTTGQGPMREIKTSITHQDHKPFSINPNEAQLLEHYRKLPDDTAELLSKLVGTLAK